MLGCCVQIFFTFQDTGWDISAQCILMMVLMWQATNPDTDNEGVSYHWTAARGAETPVWVEGPVQCSLCAGTCLCCRWFL